MSTKAQLATVITLDSTNFSKGLQNAISSLNQFSAQNKKVVAQSTGSYRKLADGVQNLANKGFGALIAASKTVAIAVGAATAATGAFLGLILKKSSAAAAQIELLQVAYTSLTGSTEEARRVLATLEAQSLKTGISVERQSSAVQKFLALGFDPQRALRLNEAILDVAGSVGLTAFQADQLGFALAQVANKGVVQMEELRQQIAEKGVPVFQALEEKTGLFGENLFKALKQNKIPAETLLEIFENLEGRFEKFRGGSERLGKTLSGTVNRIKAAIEALLRTIGEQFNVQLTQFFDNIFNVLISLQDEAAKLGEIFGKLALAVNKISKTLVQAFQQGELGQKLQQILVGAFDTAATAFKIALLEAIEFAFKDVGKLIANLGQAFKDWANPISETTTEGLRGGIALAGDVIKSTFRPALAEAFVSALVEFQKAIPDIFKGIGDAIRSTWSPELNQFIAKLQTAFEVLPAFIKEIGLTIGDLAAKLNYAIEQGALTAARTIAEAFGMTEAMTKLQDRIADSAIKMKEREIAQDKRRTQLGQDLFESLNRNLAASTPEALEESSKQSLKEGLMHIGDSLVTLGEEYMKNPLEKVEKAQYLSIEKFKDSIIYLKSILGILDLRLPKDDVTPPPPTPEPESDFDRESREGREWLERKLGPPKNILGDRPKRKFEETEMFPGLKYFDDQAKSAADTIKDSTQQSAEAYKKGADAVQNESARLANSLANTAINSKAFWDAQMGVSEGLTTTPQQSQAFFTSFENWIKNRVANSRSFAGMAPDKMTQQFIDEGLTLAVRKHFMPIYKKELGIEDPREVKEMAVEDKRTAFWNSIKQMQGTLVENTSNMNNLNDRYGKQSYDAQREANRLAKQNQSELAGINQRLGGLGLIAA